MNPWMQFWTILLVVSLLLFAGLSVIVTVGGFRDLRRLLATLKVSPEHSDHDSHTFQSSDPLDRNGST